MTPRMVQLAVVAACFTSCSTPDRVGDPFGGGVTDGGEEPGTDSTGVTGVTDGGSTGATGGSTTGGDDSESGGTGPKFDVIPDTTGNPETGGGGPCDPDLDPMCVCETPEHVACDAGTGDPFQAMGLNCPGEPQVTASVTGSAKAVGIRTGFGPTNTFDPREGSVFTVIGSGFVAELDNQNNADPDFPAQCSDDLDGTGSNTTLGPLDPDGTLPAPLDPTPVGAVDCEQDPNLVGTGDCSNTIGSQWDQGASARDYTDLRFTATVPDDVVSFSYDLAFFTVEWPGYYGSQYNDLYVGWLESEKWTGNISFDEMGNPISLNAAFFDFLDQNGTLPELQGTCMQHHGGTKWLTTTSPVTPGEEITLVFAIFDLSDSILDSYAFLDNFQWGCDPSSKPDTKPEG